MADTKLTGLTAITALIGTDIIYTVDDPGGTPLSRKITIADFFGATTPLPTDIALGDSNAFFFGDQTTDGTWKEIRDGTKLSFLRRESGTYVEKGFFDTASIGTKSIHLGDTFTIEEDLTDNDGIETQGCVHVHSVAGTSGNLCLHEGTEPTVSLSGEGHRLWPDASNVLYYQDADGLSHKVITDDGAGKIGIGTTSPDSTLHIKANTPGTVGSHPAGQLIIQHPDNDVNANVAVTAYESDGNGDPDQQLWYLGSETASDDHITLLNRRNGDLHLATNGLTRMTIIGSGEVGIGTDLPDELTHLAKAVDGISVGLLVENSQANSGGSINETAEIRFSFGGNNDVARIVAGKKSDYSDAANEDSFLAFYTDENGVATEQMRITHEGNVSIGGATLPSSPITIRHVGTVSGFIKLEDAQTNGKTLWINNGHSTAGGIGFAGFFFEDKQIMSFEQSSGNVGIGTTSPAAKLSVESNTTLSAFFTNTETSSSIAGAGMIGYSDDGAALASGDRLGFYLLGGANDGAGTLANATGISGFASENWSGTQNGAELSFEVTANGATTRSEAMRINESGNVIANNFTMLGSSAPAIKIMKLMGTTAASEGGIVATASGLTNTKILGMQVIVHQGANNAWSPEMTGSPGFQYHSWHDSAGLQVKLHDTNSENLLSKAFVAILTYIE